MMEETGGTKRPKHLWEIAKEKGPEAYRQYLSEERRAFKNVFDITKDDSRLVLTVLSQVCFAHETTMHPTDGGQKAQEGMRLVWLFIQHRLNLTEEQFWELYGDGERR